MIVTFERVTLKKGKRRWNDDDDDVVVAIQISTIRLIRRLTLTLVQADHGIPAAKAVTHMCNRTLFFPLQVIDFGRTRTGSFFRKSKLHVLCFHTFSSFSPNALTFIPRWSFFSPHKQCLSCHCAFSIYTTRQLHQILII